MLLTADLHLTDNPEEDYRWAVFGELKKAFFERGPCDIFILGDLGDRKDRHSAAFVNRLVRELVALRDFMWAALAKPSPEVHIIMGNHDAPLKGTPFWSFFEHIEGIHFYTEPAEVGEILLLPFAPNPAEAWADLDLGAYRCIMLHQPLEGARGANGRALAKGSPVPEFPKGVKVYAGDIHGPQKIGAVEYIGSPHPVAFDEAHAFRLVHLDKRYRATDIPLQPMRRHIIRIDYEDTNTFDPLPALAQTKVGDQIKVEVSLPLARIGEWPHIKAQLEALFEQKSLWVFSLKPVVQPGEAESGPEAAASGGEAPDEVLEAFAGQEGIEGRTLKMGRRLLAAAMEARK